MRRLVSRETAVLALLVVMVCLMLVLPLGTPDGGCWQQGTVLAGVIPVGLSPGATPNTDNTSDNTTEKQATEPAAIDEGTALGRPRPEIQSVEIYIDPGCTQPATSLTPQVTYYARVDIEMKMGNQLSHLREVRVTIFYDSAGTNPPPPPTGNTQTCGILLCNIDRPPLWGIDAGNPTSWQILPAESRQPDLRRKSGSWIFAFKPGKVATESVPPANWDVCAKATTKLGMWDELCIRNKMMNWYGELSFSTTLLDWGEVQPGLKFEDTPPNPQSLTAVYIANGDYGVDIKSNDWTGQATVVYLDESGGNPPAGELQFALRAGNPGNAITIRKEYTRLHQGTQTAETGVTSNNAFWLSLSQSDFPSETYSGTIYYRITER